MEITKVKKTEKGFQVFVVQRTLGIIRRNQRSTSPYFAIEVPGHTGKFEITISTARGM
jgi:hypothetical protein